MKKVIGEAMMKSKQGGGAGGGMGGMGDMPDMSSMGGF